MKQLKNIVVLSVLVLFWACGTPAPTTSAGSSGRPGSSGNSSLHQIGSNWQLSATSSVQVGLPVTLAGSIVQSGHVLSGALHVSGWNCFDQRIAIQLNGTLTDGNLTLISDSVDGQVLTFSGRITEKTGFPDAYAGTYSVSGGCADGDRGSATGYAVLPLTGNWAGSLTTDGGKSFRWSTDFTQSGPSPEGSFGLGGMVSFEDCFATGTFTPGTFPDGSLIMGTFVDLEINTDIANITFLGTADPDGLIRGKYTASIGSCELAGTGYLSPWEY
jgi:hypothetical protein